MASRVLSFVAILLTALALVPSGAHFFELPNKMSLSREHYFVVQQVYRGWSHFGIVLIGAIAANLALAISLRNRRTAFWFAFAGFVLGAATLAIFFIWTYPANEATNNWAVAPGNWEQLRRQWEYSHATNALLTCGALCSVIVATLRS